MTVMAETNPRLARIIIQKKPFLTAINVSDGEKEESYVIIDFTSTQEKHYHDLENYSVQLYNQFNKSYFNC